MQNKDLPEDLNDHDHIDPNHVGSNAKMEDDAHDGTNIDEIEGDADTDDNDDDHDDHGDDDDEVVAGNN